MTGTYVRLRSKPHECDPPNTWTLGLGTVWRCTCGRRWVVYTNWLHAPDNGRAWRRKLLPWPR